MVINLFAKEIFVWQIYYNSGKGLEALNVLVNGILFSVDLYIY